MSKQLHTEHQQSGDQTQHAWDAVADGYHRVVTPSHMALAHAALERLDLAPGMRFLDVAAGSGALARAAAARGAEVLGIDISPVMIEHLNDTARRSGVANLTGQVMDGHNLDLGDDTFDASGSMFGVMLFPDLRRGLREMARVTKPGGTVLMVTFGPPAKVEFLGVFLAAVRRVIPDFGGLPMDPPPLPFQVADPAKLQADMREAGLRDVNVETTIEIQEFAGADDLRSWIASSNPIGARLTAELPPAKAPAVRQVLDTMLRERASGNGPAKLTNPINIAIGTAT